jgi:hypothetical protein
MSSTILLSSELHSTRVPRIGQVQDLGPMEFGKVLAASISSMSILEELKLTCTLNCGQQAHGKFDLVVRYSHTIVSDKRELIQALGGYNVPLDANPFNSWAKVLDCGDIPVTS